MPQFIKHPKLYEILRKFPLARLTYSISWNDSEDYIECFMASQGKAEYHLNFFLNKKDDDAVIALKEVIEFALGGDADEILASHIKKCSSFSHRWAKYTGFREVYEHCIDCGAKKKLD